MLVCGEHRGRVSIKKDVSLFYLIVVVRSLKAICHPSSIPIDLFLMSLLIDGTAREVDFPIFIAGQLWKFKGNIEENIKQNK